MWIQFAVEIFIPLKMFILLYINKYIWGLNSDMNKHICWVFYALLLDHRASRSPVRSGVRLSPLKATKDTGRRDLKFGPGTKVNDATSSRVGSASVVSASSRSPGTARTHHHGLLAVFEFTAGLGAWDCQPFDQAGNFQKVLHLLTSIFSANNKKSNKINSISSITLLCEPPSTELAHWVYKV